MGGAEPRTHGRNGEARPGTKAVSHLGENISCIGSGCGQGGEERGLAGRLNGVDHPQLGVLQVRGLAVGVDEHKDVVHTYGREPQASRGRLRIMLLSPESDPCWAYANREWSPRSQAPGESCFSARNLERPIRLWLYPPRIQALPSMLPGPTPSPE